MAGACGSGHLGGSLSVMDILVALYFHQINDESVLTDYEVRDRVIFSKAHCCEALYAVLGEKGYFDKSLFKTFGEWGSPLQGHSEHRATLGVEYSGGSLGQGLSYAVGVALAGKLRKQDYNVYCIIGDGECHEGQIWEAVMSAAQYKLDNLVVIVDSNKHSSEPDPISEVMNISPLSSKWYAFNWDMIEVMDGNNIDELLYAFKVMNKRYGMPKCIIAHTTKGKGVGSWEDGCQHLMYGETLKSGIMEWRSKHG